MSNKCAFSLIIEFADKVTDDKELLEGATTVANAIASEARQYSIAPEGDTYTVSIEVKPVGVDEVITIKLS